MNDFKYLTTFLNDKNSNLRFMESFSEASESKQIRFRLGVCPGLIEGLGGPLDPQPNFHYHQIWPASVRIKDWLSTGQK